MPKNPVVEALLRRLREIRESTGRTPGDLEQQLILGPGWIERFESGDTIPALDVLTVILDELGSNLWELLEGVNADVDLAEATTAVDRFIHAEEAADGSGLLVHFRYADFDATYVLPEATEDDFEAVIKTLRDGLAMLVADAVDGEDRQSIKTNAVAAAYLEAVERWPNANSSDLWWFIVSRAYLDPFNHPAAYARLDLGQSWKRTGGWALEEVLVRHYGPSLQAHGIRLFIADRTDRERFIEQLAVADRLESDKMDVLLVGESEQGEHCFGVVHVKASFAERRTDDVPMSKALVEGGYTSPLWTMDCKSTPAARPVNRGELGVVRTDADGPDPRSAKRKDIEEDGYFSACFSYNRNTKPTPASQATRARIYVCDFSDPAEDQFAMFIRTAWDDFKREKLGET